MVSFSMARISHRIKTKQSEQYEEELEEEEEDNWYSLDQMPTTW
jgi:hypothetical protein